MKCFAVRSIGCGGSGNPVVFTIDSTSTASATVSGNVVTVASPGVVYIDANQAGNVDYAAAPRVKRNIVIEASGRACDSIESPSAGSRTFMAMYANGSHSPMASASASSVEVQESALQDSVINSPSFWRREL